MWNELVKSVEIIKSSIKYQKYLLTLCQNGRILEKLNIYVTEGTRRTSNVPKFCSPLMLDKVQYFGQEITLVPHLFPNEMTKTPLRVNNRKHETTHWHLELMFPF